MIMVVTFQDEFRVKISSFLSEKGYEVCVPPHRQDVLPLVKEKNPLVVVLDMYVAEPSAMEVLRELRRQSFSGKVVALSGTSISSLMPQAFQLGVSQVVGGFQGSGGALNLDQVESAVKLALHQTIAKRAFELYEARGRIHGKDLDDWLEAERQIFQRNVPSASSVPEADMKGESPKGSKKPRATKKPSSRKS